MHELSIALSLVDAVQDEIASHPSAAVRRVIVQIGELAGVEPEALLFSWECAIEGTPVAGSSLDIERSENPRDLILRSIEIEEPR